MTPETPEPVNAAPAVPVNSLPVNGEKKSRSEYMRDYMRAYRAKKASQKDQERG